MRSGKRSAKARLVIMLALAVLASALGACSSGGSGGGGEPVPATAESAGWEAGAAGHGLDLSEEVRLKMLLIGSKPADYEEVFGELNRRLKAKLNATVEAEFLGWTEWTQKYPLKFASGEDFDIAYTANWAFYYDLALKGAFVPLTEDLLARYAPKTWAAMPETAWEQARVNGQLYMVPNNNREMTDKVVIIRDDLRKKYGLAPVDSPETFAAYVKAVAAGEPGMSAFGAKPADGWKWHELDQILLEQRNDWNLVDYAMPLAYRLDDPAGRVFNVYDTPEFRSLLSYYKDLADHQGWSRNTITNKNDVWQDILAGKVASYAHNLGTVAANLAELRRDKPMLEGAIADLTPSSRKLGAISTQNGLAIHAASRHVERSLLLIDLLQNDKELHDLTMYGIAGKHYVPVGEDMMESGPDAGRYTGFSNWGWNSPLNRTDASYPREAADMLEQWEAEQYRYPLETFVFNDAEVKSEMANVGIVMIRYAIPLEYGLVADLDRGRDELLRQLEAAGIEKIRQALQAQIDAFLSR